MCLSTLVSPRDQKTSKKWQTAKLSSDVDDLNDYVEEIFRFEESRRKCVEDEDDRGNNQLASSREELLAHSEVCSVMYHSISITIMDRSI